MSNRRPSRRFLLAVSPSRSIEDGVSPFPVTTVVTITSGDSVMLTTVLPLSPADGGPIDKCPDAAQMAAIAQAYMDAIRAHPGVTGVTLVLIECKWIVSGAAGDEQVAWRWSGAGARPMLVWV
jgi:hypothetical protein